jgi:solute carrier family 31 (copper transporter), member 1
LLLEFFRRLAKEYDRYLVRQNTIQGRSPRSLSSDLDGLLEQSSRSKGATAAEVRLASEQKDSGSFRASILQQGIRAGLHMMQFGIAYIVMLLAMYYNGYFIISIFLGAFVGSFIFNWETMGGSA